jgi:hypothetical protein
VREGGSVRPVTFPSANRTLTAPRGMEQICGPLPVYTDGEFCISRWRPTWRERLAVLFGSSVWLWVVSGQTQPPVSLETRDPWRAS